MSREQLEKQVIQQLNEIKKFAYCPDFKDLSIFSRQSYKDLILNIFNNYENEYSFIFGDFDKLGVINNTFGKEAGDKALLNALKVIKYSLPKNSIISRIAGDEFSIIIPNCNKQQAKLYKNFINRNLAKYSSATGGLTITLEIEDSNKTPLAYELENITENKVNIAKSRRKASENSSFDTNDNINLPEYSNTEWRSLNSNISNSIKNHFLDLRLSDKFEYTSEDFKTEALYMIDEINNLIEKKNKFKNTHSQNYSYSSKLSPKEAKQLYKIICDTTTISNIISNLTNEELDSISTSSKIFSNLLIRNPLSNLFTKSYFESFLTKKLCDSNSEYQAIYFSNIGVKSSNTAYGHDYTDKLLKDSAKELTENLNDVCTFCNKNFSFNEKDDFIIDFGGGNYIALIEKSHFISKDKINNIMNIVNSNENILKFGYSIDNNIYKNNRSNFMKEIQKLRKNCNDNKDDLKHKTLNSPNNKLAFNKEIIGCVNKFLNTIPNARTDITEKKRFLSNVFYALINEASQYKDTSKEDSNER